MATQRPALGLLLPGGSGSGGPAGADSGRPGGQARTAFRRRVDGSASLAGTTRGPASNDEPEDQLAWWNKRLNRYFELGTVYTMIAGLLNILAVYDAFAGPVPPEVPSDESSDEDEKT